MDDSSDVLKQLAAVSATGPRDHELLELEELAVLVMVFSDLDAFPAREAMLLKLLGEGKFQGEPPSTLRLYRRYISGPEELEAVGHELEGFRYPAPRSIALRHLKTQIHRHHWINQIPAGTDNFNKVAGRFLAVVRTDALKAFGLPDPKASSPAPTFDLADKQARINTASPSKAVPAAKQKTLKRWTEEEKEVMRQQRANGWIDQRIAEHWGCKRQNIIRVIGSKSANKAKANSQNR